MPTNPSLLASNAQCIAQCIPEGMQIPALIAILDALVSTGGGGGGSAAITQGAGAPGAAPATPASPAFYVNTSNSALYYWNTTSQTWVAISTGSSSQIVTYTVGTPANPTNINSPAIAYDPTGVLPTLGWDTVGHTWN